MYYDAFISYSRRDKEFVTSLCERLKHEEHEIWVDWDDIPSAANWLEEIYEGIQEADNFVFVISPDSLTSEVCNKEITHALEHNKRIIPIVQRDWDQEVINKSWGKVLWGTIARDNLKTLSDLNFIFFRKDDDFEVSLLKLHEAIRDDPKHVKKHTRYLVKAIEWRDNNNRQANLLIGDEIREAEQWWQASQQSRKQPIPLDLHEEYIRESRKIAQRRRRILMLVAVVIPAILLFGIDQYSLAQQRNIESKALDLSAESQAAMARNNTDLGLALALEANHLASDLPHVQKALISAAYGPGTLHLFKLDSGRISSAVFSPDGKYILSTDSIYGTIILWDVETGSPVREFLGHNKGTDSIGFSPDGKLIISAGCARHEEPLYCAQSEWILWDIQTGLLIKRSLGHDGAIDNTITSIGFSPDGRYILSGSDDRTMILWDVETGNPVREFLGHIDNVNSVAFSPDGRYILSGSDDRTMILWDVETGNPVREFLGHIDNVNSVAFSPDGQLAISGSSDTTLRLWNLETGQEIYRFEGHETAVLSVAFSPNGRRVLSGSGSIFRGNLDSTMRLWSLETGQEIYQFRGHTDLINDVAFSPDGYTALTASDDGTIRLWSLKAGQEIFNLTGHSNDVTSIVFTPDGQLAISGSSDTTLRLWDLETGQQIVAFPDNAGLVFSIAISSDGASMLSGSYSTPVLLWDVQTRELVTKFEGLYDIRDVAFSPDGLSFLAGSFNGNVSLWDIDTKNRLSVFKEQKLVKSVAFDLNQSRIVSGGDTLLVLDIHTGAILHRLEGHHDHITSVAFSFDGQLILSGSADHTMRLWDADTGHQIQLFEGHTDEVLSIAFSPDGKRVASGSSDHMIKIWNIETGNEITTLEGHTDKVLSIAFSPDGHHILSGSMDNTLRLWRALTNNELIEWIRENRYVRELTCEEKQQYDTGSLCDSFE